MPLNWLRAAAAAESLQSCPTLCDPIDSSHQDAPSLGFSRQEHWSGLPFPSPMHEGEGLKSQILCYVCITIICIHTCVYMCNFSRHSRSVRVPWAFLSLVQSLVLSGALPVFVAMKRAAKLLVGAGAGVRTAHMPTSLFQHIQFSFALTAPKKGWGLWTSIQRCRETPPASVSELPGMRGTCPQCVLYRSCKRKNFLLRYREAPEVLSPKFLRPHTDLSTHRCRQSESWQIRSFSSLWYSFCNLKRNMGEKVSSYLCHLRSKKQNEMWDIEHTSHIQVLSQKLVHPKTPNSLLFKWLYSLPLTLGLGGRESLESDDCRWFPSCEPWAQPGMVSPGWSCRCQVAGPPTGAFSNMAPDVWKQQGP